MKYFATIFVILFLSPFIFSEENYIYQAEWMVKISNFLGLEKYLKPQRTSMDYKEILQKGKNLPLLVSYKDFNFSGILDEKSTEEKGITKTEGIFSKEIIYEGKEPFLFYVDVKGKGKGKLSTSKEEFGFELFPQGEL
ncbi:MAG: hypothetical protein WHV67_08845, partial [Thermoanaerobaculia bacterium]